jgi:hypothetical protein
VPWCVEKKLARQALKNFLPNAVLNRPKTPLAADPLEVSIETGRWIPSAPDSPPAALRSFLDWEEWRASLKYSKGCTSVPNLFPLALLDWLKDVENGEGIK